MTHEGVTKCEGIGDICLKTSNDTKVLLRRVKHVLDIKLNLLSINKLCDKGYKSYFSGDNWKLTKGSMVVARGKKHSTLYLTQIKVINDVVSTIESDNKTDFVT
ncbi:Retrovirus-related Pol polyprotein from transposon TNT 1-94 [Apostasia shenzhenica]|uniref:Retrovirus-related Pol polyprotein from transposon TNT 1-94 n=1 Tax=Apostasia shenzhenica TaxID=1088818 RepID=A0A2I0BFP1_9ASPA|nr:Retrovirus-related Pol polyprotein from transposon TNT 1-94 [Apostasia shenzhenica]